MKKLTKTFCTDQIHRLTQKRFFPTDDTVLDELINTLWKGAKSEEHAERIITRAVRTPTFGTPPESRCPEASDIWALCRTIPADRKLDIDAEDFKPASPIPCDQCREHTGWVETTVVLHGTTYTAMRKCPCGAVSSLVFDSAHPQQVGKV